MTVYELKPGGEQELTIIARDRYSRERVRLIANVSYEISCSEDQHWWDLMIRTTPRGYKHGPANRRKRISDAPIFSLCAALLRPGGEETDEKIFQVMEPQPFTLRVDEERILCFFANDMLGWEWNNFGRVNVVVRRM